MSDFFPTASTRFSARRSSLYRKFGPGSSSEFRSSKRSSRRSRRRPSPPRLPSRILKAFLCCP